MAAGYRAKKAVLTRLVAQEAQTEEPE